MAFVVVDNIYGNTLTPYSGLKKPLSREGGKVRSSLVLFSLTLIFYSLLSFSSHSLPLSHLPQTVPVFFHHAYHVASTNGGL